MGSNFNLKVGDKVVLHRFDGDRTGEVITINSRFFSVIWSGRSVHDSYFIGTRAVRKLKGEEIIDRLLEKYS